MYFILAQMIRLERLTLNLLKEFLPPVFFRIKIEYLFSLFYKCLLFILLFIATPRFFKQFNYAILAILLSKNEFIYILVSTLLFYEFRCRVIDDTLSF